jgi:hypothetical protein
MRKFSFASILLMFGFAVVISVPCSVQVAVAQDRTVTIQVPANIAWVQTGVMLSPGMIVQIEAWGSVEAASPSDARLFYHQVPPEGRRELHAEKPQPLYPALALLGKIGNGPVFLVGSGVKLYVESPYGSGQLFLGINDDILTNNSGAWSVRVTILWGEPSISAESSLLNLECQSELERIQVPATTPQETYSRMVLESGRTYVLQISGAYSFWSGRTDGVDALYNYLSQPPILWSPLQINGEPLKDLIEAAGGSPEYRSDHIYRIGIVGNGQPLALRINDGGGYSDNSGSLTIQICLPIAEETTPSVPSPAVERPLLNLECQSELERIQVPATTPQETYSRTVLESGRTYVLQLSGAYSFWSGRTDGVDAIYNYLSQPPILWSPLQINGEPLKDLIEAAGGSPEYRSDHIYRIGIVGNGQPLALRIHDGGTYSDNSGSLTIQICLPGTEGAKPTSEKEGDPLPVARRKAARDVNKVLWLGVGCCAGPGGILIGYVAAPSPPATAFIGKSPEYVDTYTAAYKAKAKSLQAKYSLYGCVGATIIWAVGSCIAPYLW